MSRTHLSLNGKQYLLAHKDLIPEGGRQFNIDNRAWQPGDPAKKITALWQPDGPNLFTNEEISEQAPDGYLGIDYLDGCDSRWGNLLTLGPALTAATLSGSDTTFPETLLDVSALLDQNTGLDASPTAGMVSQIVTSPDANGAGAHIYYGRQGYVTKQNAVTLAVEATQSFTDNVTDLIATQTPSNVREVSAALQASAYQVANPIAASGADTWAANSSGEIARVFGKDPQRVVEGQLSSGQTNWRGNILAGAVTMLAPAWNTVTQIVNSAIVPTGFTVDGYRWVLGTSGGPYYLDPNLGTSYALLPSTDINTENSRNLGFWEFLGAIIPGRYGIRFQRANIGRSFGVETFEGNHSTVQGYPTAYAGSARWLYEARYNPTTSTTWLVAYHPDNREIRPNRIVSPFVIGKIPSSNVSRAMNFVGTANQLRTTSILVMGNGTNSISTVVGETPQEIDDSNFRYITSGTAYMTELRRYPNLLKDIEAIEFESANCTAARTITVSLVVSGDSTQPTTITLNGALAGVNDVISTNGYQRRLFVDGSNVPLTTATSRRIKPQIAFATNVSTTAPQIIGPIRLYMTLRPIQIDEYTVYVQLETRADGATAYDQIQELSNLQEAGPVLVSDDWWGNSYYVRVSDVQIPPAQLDSPTGSPDDPQRGAVYVVPVKMAVWNTTLTGITPST